MTVAAEGVVMLRVVLLMMMREGMMSVKEKGEVGHCQRKRRDDGKRGEKRKRSFEKGLLH